MVVSGSWDSTLNGSVYTARATLDAREAIVRLHVGVFVELHLRHYVGDFGKREVERAGQAMAAIRVRHLPA
jgi:hypothetical protein